MADKVFSYADEMEALTDEQLQAKTAEFKERYNNGESSTIFCTKLMR